MIRKATWFFMGICATALLAGCATSSSSKASNGKGQGSWFTRTERQKSGAQLWAENCARCHNLRAPGSFDDAQWDVAMMHMRERANLTGYQQRAILKFLKSAN